MTREPMREQELEATLTDLGERLAYPRPTRLGDCRARAPARASAAALVGRAPFAALRVRARARDARA